ncbi:helix-turn-helix transcriptional regulator [Brevibacterium luteolum]|uniref:Helix-turn-helix transcriptional regulator n=2 Tax=Brevibacterium luteolum TaxID=199591 RepID=A0A2N6PJQ1_9MICO|nr:helix-turn-helix transcriptional regulator [Brevibacterium luteolum]PMB98922.1 XRE family transcriptional regulator [Brevibacterium luteolum]
MARLQFTRGDRLAKSLSAAGLSSQEMAQHLGVSRNTISNWLNDRTSPRRAELILWAMRTQVPLEWIETGELKNRRPDGPDGGSSGDSRATRDSNPQPSDP